MAKNPIATLKYTRELSRAMLARQIGMSYATLSSIDHGLVTTLKPKTLDKLSGLLNQPPETIHADYKAWREQLKQAA